MSLSLRARAALVCYGAALSSVAVVLAVGAGRGWALDRELFWVRGTGWCALAGLLLTLSVSPIAKLIDRLRTRSSQREANAIRRALGIASAALATLHAALSIATYLRGTWTDLFELAWLRGGVVALLILWPLWLTSYPRLVARARVTLWKPLHRLSYVAALFTLQHVLLGPMAPRAWVIGAFGLTVAIGLLRLVPRRQSSSIPSHSESQAET